MMDNNVTFLNTSEEVLPQTTRIFASVTAAVVSFLVTTNNIVAIMVYMRVDVRKDLPNTSLYISLALADLLVGLQGWFLIYPPLIGYWPHPFWLCKFFAYTLLCSLVISVQMLACLSVDRFYLICHSLQYSLKVTPRRCHIAVASIWLSNGAVFLPLLIMENGFKYGPPNNTCAWNFSNPLVFNISLAYLAGCLFPPTALITYSYFRIVNVARRLKVQPQGQAGASVPTAANWKALRTLTVIIGVYFMCWTPGGLSGAVIPFFREDFPAVNIMFAWIALSNSFMNCFIYVATQKDFRDGLKKLIQCK